MRPPAIDSAAQERHVAESELVETGFALRNRRIGDLMLPRAAITWPDTDRPFEEREPLRLPQTMRLLAALEAMRRTRTELALVVNEDGSELGMVTARGLLEALAAEVLVGIRPPRPESIRRSDGSWLLDGMHPIADFRMLFGRDRAADGDEHAYHTLAGLVLAQLDRLPSIGDALEWDGLRIEVVDLDGRRIDKLLVTPVA